MNFFYRKTLTMTAIVISVEDWLAGVVAIRQIVLATLVGLVLVGCSEQLPVMTIEQQKTYSNCMSGRWSGAADTFWWGPFG